MDGIWIRADLSLLLLVFVFHSQLKSFDPSLAQPSLGENGQPDVLLSQELLVDASMEESSPQNEENALMTVS